MLPKMVALNRYLSYIRLLMDTFSRDQRSQIMRRVRSRGTQPELTVRSIVRRMGIKYRTCARALPGKPDLVILGQRKAILVHGCFWHGHHCERGELPKSNRSYWESKQFKNAVRDKTNARSLRSRGWTLMVIWECQIRESKRLEARLSRFLSQQPS
jgi:DNA mismatch endonuclease, patch repair protein